MRLKLFAVTGILLVTPLCAAVASSFNQLEVFGDSLSDNGNAYIFSAGTFPGPNYGVYTFAGTGVTTSFYTDGPNTTPLATGPQGLWVDQLAGRLGVPDPLPFLKGGTDYAFASAQTGTANPQDVGNQLKFFAAANLTGAPSHDLYALWAGANDIIAGNNPVQAADNLESYIKDLASAGAKDFVWLNLPLLGDTPRGSANKAALNAASTAFNVEWASDIKALQGDGLDVTGVDIGALFASIIGDPAKYGITNVTDAAQTSGASTDAGYLSWDGLHPTTYGHELVANTVYDSLTATATPEPTSLSLAFFGFVALAGFGLRNRLSVTKDRR